MTKIVQRDRDCARIPGPFLYLRDIPIGDLGFTNTFQY